MALTTLIIRTAGTNCDRELAHAFELAGSATQTLHLNELIKSPAIIERFDLIGFPGGFSYGDDIAAGRIFANRLRHHLLEPLKAAIGRGVPMIGVCNGFQVLVKLGLLPEPDSGEQTATLADNSSGRFTDKWISLRAVPESVCVWTKGLTSLDLPIAHGEGRFVPVNDTALQRLRDRGQIALRYATEKSEIRNQKSEISFPGNPNGSTDDIAGVCDPSGLVLGLMPHPERYCHATNHPTWTRQAAGSFTQTPAGLQFFRNAVGYIMNKSTLAVG